MFVKRRQKEAPRGLFYVLPLLGYNDLHWPDSDRLFHKEYKDVRC
jgi:hypothetical protein